MKFAEDKQIQKIKWYDLVLGVKSTGSLARSKDKSGDVQYR